MTEKKQLPKFCPLFSIADVSSGEYTGCLKDDCQLYSTKMKMCAIVIQALAQSNIATHLTTTTIKRDFESKMDSVKRQHRATD